MLLIRIQTRYYPSQLSEASHEDFPHLEETGISVRSLPNRHLCRNCWLWRFPRTICRVSEFCLLCNRFCTRGNESPNSDFSDGTHGDLLGPTRRLLDVQLGHGWTFDISKLVLRCTMALFLTSSRKMQNSRRAIGMTNDFRNPWDSGTRLRFLISGRECDRKNCLSESISLVLPPTNDCLES